MPAVTIADCIALAPTDIAAESYGGVHSLFTLMNTWITGMFSQATGIFPPSSDPTKDPGQRPVTNWLGAHKLAVNAIEGPGVGASGAVGTSAVINAVERVLNAVSAARTNNLITAGQVTAVVALYNAVWES